tara:strand:+ start:1449 stop:2486 length:1038 start_codon:yes stop_codon:yes gene_type:complete
MSIDNEKISQWLNKNDIDYINDFNISIRSWLKAGGVIKTYITPKNEQEIIKIINFFNEEKQEYETLGNLSNVIIRDGCILTPIINLTKLSKISQKPHLDKLEINVDAGVSIPRFANYIMKQEYSGTESLIGIPGSIGGGIYMNASCYGSELTEFLVSIKSINSNGEVIIRDKKQAKFDWRKSIYHENQEIITSAVFRFPFSLKKDINIIKSKKEKIQFHRKKIQESDYPNLGSLFATKDLYSDIKFVSIKFFFLYLFNKFVLILINNKIYNKIDILSFRKKINNIYRKNFQINSNHSFSLSDKTINCLINKGSQKAQDAIKTVYTIKKIVGRKVKLENIILDKIK